MFVKICVLCFVTFIFMYGAMGYFTHNYQIIPYSVTKNIHETEPVLEDMEDFSQYVYGSPLVNITPFQYLNTLQTYYEYTDVKDCKYWSYVWYEYFKNRLDYDVQYVFTNTHMFVVAYNDSGYFIAEQDELYWYS